MSIRRTEGIPDGAAPDLPGFHPILLRKNTPAEVRAAQVHVADRVAAERPLHDPQARTELRGLLAMLGLLPESRVAA